MTSEDSNNSNISKHKLKTTITKVEPDKIITRGYNQEELIENLSFAEMIYLILRGKLPKKEEGEILNHILVSFCDHGVTPPSTQTARIIASSGSPLNNAVGGGLLSFGYHHAGAIEKVMVLFQNAIKSLYISGDSELDDPQITDKALDIVYAGLSRGQKIPGFGHRYHKRDPRARKLVDLVIDKGHLGPHTKLAISIEHLLIEKKGIYLNVDGINGAILSDLGFNPKFGLGLFMIGRLPGLIAHSYEETMDDEEFRRFCDIDDINYEGFENITFKK
ncbi:citryl-CoA lyase [uncultured Methanobrevibacter sp.]|uniref:citryl-CoA lyase n=1 Tax=uncultured Methanobrevibacter sp. TaxID=253161 RepID=UPI0025D3082A|nr:citryl-CoA lyase [uncultured Methanobrevibacter sp.]